MTRPVWALGVVVVGLTAAWWRARGRAAQLEVWLERDKQQRNEVQRRLKRERGQLRAENKELHDRVGKLERQKGQARSGHVTSYKIIRDRGCTKGWVFFTRESADAQLVEYGLDSKMHAYPCAACATSSGQPVFHVGHRLKAHRHTRALRLAANDD